MIRLTAPVALAISATFLGSVAEGHDRPHTLSMNTELKQFSDLPHGAAADPDAAEVPLWPGLGTITYAITTSNPRAQAYFDQGLRLAYGFNHAEARRSFRAAQRLDPACAMCFWGEALVLGPNINAPMEEAANEPALAALGEAERLARRASAREKGLIAALATRYSADPARPRAALDAAYADAMARLAARFPDDRDIAVLYAEALMDLAPWDYWEAGGSKPKGRTADLVATLERVLAADPDHAGAIHLYIHTVEASDRPERAEPYADRLARQKLNTGHLAHMPSHIYYRIGRYRDSLDTNRLAVAVDERFLDKVKDQGIYAGGYYPHNIHFLLVSAQMAGDGPTVIEAAEKLSRTVSDEAARKIGWVQPIKAGPLFAHAQFSDPHTILALPEPSGSFPYVAAMWRYARGVAYAAMNDPARARAEAEAIARLAEADFSDLAAAAVPAPDLIRVARHMVLARTAQAEGDLRTAVAEIEAAAALEEKLPYMEPPFWYSPTQQTLGAVLLMAGDAARAEQAFRKSLKQAPHNGWALFGLAEALKAQGETAEATAMLGRLDKVWAGDRKLLDLKRL